MRLYISQPSASEFVKIFVFSQPAVPHTVYQFACLFLALFIVRVASRRHKSQRSDVPGGAWLHAVAI
eukprot:SAG31_NODE_25381_length_461_cov_1.074380_2_plen_66_part_01